MRRLTIVPKGWRVPALIALSLAATAARTDNDVDERAIEIARQALDAMRTHWALERYDDSNRMRTAISARGQSDAGQSLALTANVVLDRAARMWRVDAAGDIGPLTVHAAEDRLTLHVPALGQFAHYASGAFAPARELERGVADRMDELRQRLDAGYPTLVYGGEEAIDGVVTDRIDDTPRRGAVASYWIDRRTHLPRRVEVVEGGERATADLHYNAGPRPSRIDVAIRGERSATATIVPSYIEDGRITRFTVAATSSDGANLDLDIHFDWDPSLGDDHLVFVAPEGAAEVPFGQLVSGVLFMAMGKLGPLMSTFGSGS